MRNGWAGGGCLALCHRNYLVGRALRLVCLSGKGFSFLVRWVLITHTGLRFVSNLLPLPSKCWDYKWGPPHLTKQDQRPGDRADSKAGRLAGRLPW